MNRQNGSLENTNLLLTKIDNLLQHSRATRQNIARQYQQKGGAIPGFVSLDTPVNNMTGGDFNIDSEFDRTDACLATADKLLGAFAQTDNFAQTGNMVGGCGCAGRDTSDGAVECGSNSYDQTGGSKQLGRSAVRARVNTNLLSEIDRELNSIDALLKRY